MDSNRKTIEQRTAEAVLQKPKEVTIRGRKYTIAPPSIATLILASEAVSKLPALKLDTESVVEEVLRNARDCEAIGELVAVLLLGAKRIREGAEPTPRKHSALFGLIKWEASDHRDTPLAGEKEALARELLEDLTPREMYTLLTEALVEMQLQDFFGLTTFLTEINLTRPTRKVATGATASGQ